MLYVIQQVAACATAPLAGRPCARPVMSLRGCYPQEPFAAASKSSSRRLGSSSSSRTSNRLNSRSSLGSAAFRGLGHLGRRAGWQRSRAALSASASLHHCINLHGRGRLFSPSLRASRPVRQSSRSLSLSLSLWLQAAGQLLFAVRSPLASLQGSAVQVPIDE